MTFWDNLAENGFTMLTDKICRILKFSPTDRITESKRCFRWITPIESNDMYILQYIIRESFFVDLVYCSKSTLPNAGYGLFAATDYRYAYKHLFGANCQD